MLSARLAHPLITAANLYRRQHLSHAYHSSLRVARASSGRRSSAPYGRVQVVASHCSCTGSTGSHRKLAGSAVCCGSAAGTVPAGAVPTELRPDTPMASAEEVRDALLKLDKLVTVPYCCFFPLLSPPAVLPGSKQPTAPRSHSAGSQTHSAQLRSAARRVAVVLRVAAWLAPRQGGACRVTRPGLALLQQVQAGLRVGLGAHRHLPLDRAATVLAGLRR